MRAFTGYLYSVSMGFGSMSDRVSTPRVNVHVADDMDMLELPAFRAALELIRDARSADANSLGEVKAFLEARDQKLAEGGRS